MNVGRSKELTHFLSPPQGSISLPTEAPARSGSCKGRAIPFQGSVGVAYAREQKTEEVPQKVVSTAGSAKIAIMMRRRGKEASTDVPFTSRTIGELALVAILRDLSIAELMGQVLAGAIKKDMIKEILRSDVPSSSGSL
jgi:hypothetical protein